MNQPATENINECLNPSEMDTGQKEKTSENNDLTLKAIDELKEFNFFIPDYQRGYRWQEQQVNDLLNDINEFDNSNDDSFYCLQPLVVMRNDDTWRVIDGQQRLTTIYLILYYLNGEEKSDMYSVSYERHDKKVEALKDPVENKIVKHRNENKTIIDSHFISHAFDTIKTFFDPKKSPQIDTGKFKTKLLESVKVIWYEIKGDAEDENEKKNIEVSAFTRLNAGKIPLKNSELIKAELLINTKQQHEKIMLATQWDNIENMLQDDTLFSFICNDEKEYPDTRIDYIFDMIYGYNAYEYSTYNQLKDKLKKEENTVKGIWQEIRTYARIIEELYNEPEYYHYVGYLVHCGTKFNKIAEEYKNPEKNKTAFSTYLVDEIKNIVEIKIADYSMKDKKERDKKIREWSESLLYKEKNDLITKILTLFNVETTLHMHNGRYPFDKHREKKWSLEHIHPQNPEKLTDLKKQKEFLKEVNDYVSKNLQEKIKEFDDFLKFEELSTDINEELSGSKDPIHDISNLALLSRVDNSSLNNSPFPVKRKKILKMDIDDIYFIPVCTRNVFLKYYTAEENTSTTWTQNDRDKYIENMCTVLKKFIKVSENGE